MEDNIIKSEEALQESEKRFGSGVYGKRPVSIVRGKGAVLWDAFGNSYIDCVGGQGAANIGHSNDQINRAISEQAQQLVSCPEMFHNPIRAALQQRLCSLTGMGRTFLCNSGTEAVEAALKFARLLTGKTEIVAAKRGFHGRSMGALSATWEHKYRKPFEPLVPGFSHIVFNDIDSLKEAVTEKTAALILEPMQGEGGVHPADPEFLKAARELCTEKGALLILDEIQTGFGRTGKMFAFEHYGIKPDLLCLAKSIAGGLPMGAALIADSLGSIKGQTHGSTFGGNPVICAASLAAIGFIAEEKLADHAAELGAWFMAELNKINSSKIREIRGKGLMIGIELREKVTPYLKALMDKSVMALPAGLTVLRLLPPLVIQKSQLEVVLTAIKEVLED